MRLDVKITGLTPSKNLDTCLDLLEGNPGQPWVLEGNPG